MGETVTFLQYWEWERGMILEWVGGERFRASTPVGSQVLDGERVTGASPTDALLIALAACMGIDIVDILAKGRQELTGCRIEASGLRREEPPRRFTAITLEVELTGRNLSRQKAERAVELSRTKYCSVWNSMAPDIDLTVNLEITDRDA